MHLGPDLPSPAGQLSSSVDAATPEGSPNRGPRPSGVLRRTASVLVAVLALAGCGQGAGPRVRGQGPPAQPEGPLPGLPHARPQVVEPAAGVQAAAVTPTDPVGDPTAHAPPLSKVRTELHQEFIVVGPSSGTYINPLRFVTLWERTDQGVDAQMPVGAPILAPCRVKILGIEADWYLTQPLVYYELLEGPYAGKVQYVAEQITDIARPGTFLPQGGTIARYARTGTAIEFGWSTLNGITLARATTGYEEGQITPAGRSIRDWLNSLGAGAGPS